MTAVEVSARNDGRVPCPQAGCGYSAEPRSSIAGHVAMAHPEVPMDALAPRRRLAAATTSAAAPEPTPDGHATRALEADERATSGAAPAAGSQMLLEIPLELVDVGSNVRVTLEAIDELAASIAEHGVLQPVKASRTADGRYRLLWGQRRVLAARLAGLVSVPAIVSDDVAAGERPIEQLVENLHRADLNPIDRAQAMRAVVDGGISQADLARKLGVAPSTVSNDLRLLTLAEPVQEQIRAGEISASHGKAMASLPAKQQQALADRVVGARLSSKDLELELEWKRDEAANEAARAERTTEWIPKALAALLAAAVAKGVEIRVSGNSYNGDRDAIAADIRKAGWTNVVEGYGQERPTNGKCDCTAIRLEVGGRKAEIVGACADASHQDRQRNVDHVLEEEARKAFEARKVAVQHEIERQLRASGLHPLVLQLLRKAIDTYGATPRPDSDVIDVIALAVVQTWRVREALTPELLAELGIEVPA